MMLGGDIVLIIYKGLLRCSKYLQMNKRIQYNVYFTYIFKLGTQTCITESDEINVLEDIISVF